MPGRPGSFAAYLEYTQRNRATPGSFHPATSHAEQPPDLLQLLSLQPEGCISIGQLAGLSGRSAGAFYEFLKLASESGLVQLDGPALEQTVTLTPKGREFAKLA